MLQSSNILVTNISAESTPVSTNRLKLDYLYDEKSRLEDINQQLFQNCHLLRHINSSLVESKEESQYKQLIQHLNQQNILLQKAVARMQNENQKLNLNLLLERQIVEESQQQFRQTLKSYQEKIYEIRKSLHSKEDYIQYLEVKVKDNQNIIPVHPTNVTMLFYQEIDHYRSTIQIINKQNKLFEKQNLNLKTQNQYLLKKLEFVEIMCKSEVTYKQFRQFSNNKSKKSKSSLKKNCRIHQDQKLIKNELNDGQLQTQQSMLFLKRPGEDFKKIISKYYHEINKSHFDLLEMKNKLTENQRIKQNLVKAYQELVKKIQKVLQELNYYKQSNRYLLNIIACSDRKLKRGKSSQQNEIERLIQAQKQQKKILFSSKQKKYWKNVGASIKIVPKRVMKIRKQSKFDHRSLSCVLDYHFFQQKHQNIINQHQHPIKKQSQEEEGDFSLMMQQKDFQFDDQFSIIKHDHHEEKEIGFEANFDQKVKKSQVKERRMSNFIEEQEIF